MSWSKLLWWINVTCKIVIICAVALWVKTTCRPAYKLICHYSKKLFPMCICNFLLMDGVRKVWTSWIHLKHSAKKVVLRNSPGLFSNFLPRVPQSRTLEIRMRICFWQSDLLLLGQGLRLLGIWRLAWGSLTSLRCRISELARAAILLCPAHPWCAEGVSGLPTSSFTQGHGEEEQTRADVKNEAIEECVTT